MVRLTASVQNQCRVSISCNHVRDVNGSVLGHGAIVGSARLQQDAVQHPIVVLDRDQVPPAG